MVEIHKVEDIESGKPKTVESPTEISLTPQDESEVSDSECVTH